MESVCTQCLNVHRGSAAQQCALCGGEITRDHHFLNSTRILNKLQNINTGVWILVWVVLISISLAVLGYCLNLAISPYGPRW